MPPFLGQRLVIGVLQELGPADIMIRNARDLILPVQIPQIGATKRLAKPGLTLKLPAVVRLALATLDLLAVQKVLVDRAVEQDNIVLHVLGEPGQGAAARDAEHTLRSRA